MEKITKIVELHNIIPKCLIRNCWKNANLLQSTTTDDIFDQMKDLDIDVESPLMEIVDNLLLTEEPDEEPEIILTLVENTVNLKQTKISAFFCSPSLPAKSQDFPVKNELTNYMSKTVKNRVLNKKGFFVSGFPFPIPFATLVRLFGTQNLT